jgi:hypothetical protein
MIPLWKKLSYAKAWFLRIFASRLAKHRKLYGHALHSAAGSVTPATRGSQFDLSRFDKARKDLSAEPTYHGESTHPRTSI